MATFVLSKGQWYFGRIFVPAGVDIPKAVPQWSQWNVNGRSLETNLAITGGCTGICDTVIPQTTYGDQSNTLDRTFWFSGRWDGFVGEPYGTKTNVELIWVDPDTGKSCYVYDLYDWSGNRMPAQVRFPSSDQPRKARPNFTPNKPFPDLVFPDGSPVDRPDLGPSEDQPAPAKSSALLWILGGLAVVGIGVAVAMSGTDEKKAKRNPSSRRTS